MRRWIGPPTPEGPRGSPLRRRWTPPPTAAASASAVRAEAWAGAGAEGRAAAAAGAGSAGSSRRPSAGAARRRMRGPGLSAPAWRTTSCARREPGGRRGPEGCRTGTSSMRASSAGSRSPATATSTCTGLPLPRPGPESPLLFDFPSSCCIWGLFEFWVRWVPGSGHFRRLWSCLFWGKKKEF